MFKNVDWKKLILDVLKIVIPALLAGGAAGQYCGHSAGEKAAQTALAAKK